MSIVGINYFFLNQQTIASNRLNLLTGPLVDLRADWVGTNSVPFNLPILIMAGHADSQGLAGSGTPGAAVALTGAKPMNPEISDELYWNLKIRDSVVKLGLEQGLNIKSYDPINRNIVDGNNPNTNWSIGAVNAKKGTYVIELHFDSYGEYGFGSGLIPALTSNLNTVDESLAKEFGRYPLFFRGGLGAPKRGIRILEIGKLEGKLEENLRNIQVREKTILDISARIIQALKDGINK